MKNSGARKFSGGKSEERCEKRKSADKKTRREDTEKKKE